MSPGLVVDCRKPRRAPPSADRPSALLSKGGFWRGSGTLRLLPMLQRCRACVELRSAGEKLKR